MAVNLRPLTYDKSNDAWTVQRLDHVNGRGTGGTSDATYHPDEAGYIRDWSWIRSTANNAHVHYNPWTDDCFATVGPERESARHPAGEPFVRLCRASIFRSPLERPERALTAGKAAERIDAYLATRPELGLREGEPFPFEDGFLARAQGRLIAAGPKEPRAFLIHPRFSQQWEELGATVGLPISDPEPFLGGMRQAFTRGQLVHAFEYPKVFRLEPGQGLEALGPGVALGPPG